MCWDKLDFKWETNLYSMLCVRVCCDSHHWWLDVSVYFSSVWLICSVQKLSEFFSSDEIGDEQEPRATITSGSSNHNQNRYQAVVSICAHTFLGGSAWFRQWGRQHLYLAISPASRLSHFAVNVVFFLHLIIFLLISPFTPLFFMPDAIQSSSSHPLNLSLRPPPPLCPDTSSPWRW